jgi:hypothetical protein
LISKTPEKTAAFVTGEIGENKTYKSVAVQIWLKMVFMHKFVVNA